jgi:hypothetical protein
MVTVAPVLGLWDAPQRICCATQHQVERVEGLSNEGGPTEDGTRQGYRGSAAPPGRDGGAVAGRGPAHMTVDTCRKKVFPVL